MSAPTILAIDAGTTGVRALLVGERGGVVAQAYRELTQHYPRPGWVEHDAEEIWQATQTTCAEALAAAPDHAPIALGIANQRETCLFWDRRSGRPLHRAIVWQCRRSADICAELRAAGHEPALNARTGLRLDPYFSGTKALWLTRADPALRVRIAAGDVCFGTIDSWLLWKLTDGRVHATDSTNAARTLAFDIHTLAWDAGLLELFGLRPAVMPAVQPAGSVFGETRGAGALPDGLPIGALVGDQQAALYGQGCLHPGMVKATYGTGCFILTHTGARPVASTRGLLTTPAATLAGEPAAYALEGAIFSAGAAVQWCRDNLGLIVDASEGEALAASVTDSGGVVFVPAFAGLGSPHWGPDVRGALYGLSSATTRAQIVRAALDAIVFQAKDVLAVMAAETGLAPAELRVDGGVASNDRLMQLQADLAGCPLSRPASVESTALGAAYLAGVTSGFWSPADLANLRVEAARFTPAADRRPADAAYARWQAAIAGLLATALLPSAEDGRA